MYHKLSILCPAPQHQWNTCLGWTTFRGPYQAWWVFFLYKCFFASKSPSFFTCYLFFFFWLLITRTIPNWYRLNSFSTCLKVAWMRLWHIQMVWEGTGAGTGVTCAYTRTIPFYCYEISNHRHSRQTCGLFWQTWMKLWGTVSQKVIRLHWDRERVKC